MLKSIIKSCVPPIVKNVRTHLSNYNQGKDIFRGDSDLFKCIVSEASAYGEYGCGASTVWVANNTNTPIQSVDSSLEWIQKVRSEIGEQSNHKLTHVDLGALGDWGRPKSYKFRTNIATYVGGIWNSEKKPNVVLVDGRFRVACMLSSLLHGEPGTHILFDDYFERPHYHLVEEYASVTRKCGDQALFLVPNEIDKSHIAKELERFMYVME